MEARLTMSIVELGQALGISKNLAYSLAKRNELGVPVIRLGHRLLVSRAAIERLLQDGQEKGAGDGGR